MSKTPSVSVVMPAYNSGTYIRDAIESILDQTISDLELVIVNDGSTDETHWICESLAKIDSRILLLNQNNMGIAAALNNAINISRAPLIARMDADDIALPTRLEKQIEYLAKNSDITLVSCAFTPIDKLSAPVSPTVVLPLDHQSIYATLAFSSPICHPGVLTRRELFNYFSYRTGVAAEDHDLWCRAIHHFRFANLSEPLLLYRCHENSITSRKKRSLKWSTMQSGLLHIVRDPITFRQACKDSLNLDRGLYPAINWKWMDRINRLLWIK